ncbi:DUF6542 domain-containing protein [Rhodococcus zopfii]|uniref:DUF6542 domain-containing protein n=1 Tax=Rhodococcus zopfii TaxID=43772 RepID=UPI001111021D|nr:DUF6542 domain-containing protein [Rhodococcus zopfii]
MSASQRARSAVPLDMRSLAPTMPGVPWWGAIVIAAGATLLGAVLDAFRGDELTTVFSVFYVLGCIAAVVAVQHRGVFTAMAQPPLLLVTAIPLAQELLFESSGSGLRDLALNVAYPLVNRFPAMLVATAAVLVIGGVRIYLAQQDGTGRPAAAKRSRNSASRGSATRTAAAKRSRPASQKTPERATAPRRDIVDEPVARPRAATAPARSRPSPDAAPQKPARPRREREPSAPKKASVRQVADTRDNPAVQRRPVDDGGPRRAEPVSRREPDPTRREVLPERQAPLRATPRPQVSTPAYPPPAVRYRDRYED